MNKKDGIMPSWTLHVIIKDKNTDKNDGNTGHVISMQDALEHLDSNTIPIELICTKN